MSQFYDQSSLVFLPSGYKSGKLYSQKPLSADGELTFTRASNASRVNADGLLEKVRTNLLLQSNTFTTTWSLNASTATSGQADKDGGTDAWLISWGTTQGTSFIYQSVSSLTIPHTASCWVKGAAGLKIRFGYGANVGQGTDITFTGEWQRISHTSSSGNLFFFSNYITGLASSFYVQYCQSEVSDFGPTDYIPTTTSARSTFAGITVDGTSVPNVPRLDYTDSTCPKLLLEPSRTNLLTYSEQFDNAVWSKNAVSVTANNAVSPDGYQNADLITADGTNTQHCVLQGQTQSAKTISVFAKMGSQRYLQILTSGTSAALANYDLQTGAVGGLGAASTASMVDYGNGWWRIILTSTDALTGTAYFCFASSLSAPRFEAFSSTGTLYLWGAQAEANASYPTSYISTQNAAVTRVSDSAFKTGIASLIGQTEGTIFLDVDFNFVSSGGIRTFFSLEGSVPSQFSGISANTTNNGNNVNYAGTTYALTQGRHKIACTYNQTANQAKLFVDGEQRGSTGTFSGFLASIDKFSVLCRVNPYAGFTTDRPLFGGDNQCLIFKTALTNAALAELTAL